LVSDIKERKHIEDFLKTGCWGEYFGLSDRRVGKICVMRSLITCTLRQIQVERSSKGYDGQGI
jgi:hypothetical protein